MSPHETPEILDPAAPQHSPAHAPPHAHPARRQSNTGAVLSLLALLLIAGLLVGFFLMQRHRRQIADALAAETLQQANAAPIVDVVSVKYAPPTNSIALPGDTAGWYQSKIYARVSGYVDKWYADIGDHVKQGQVLATIDTPDLDQQLIAAQQKLHVSQAEVKVAEAATQFAKTTYERWRDSPRGVVSEQERAAKEAEFDSSVARLNAAQAQVNADQANVDQLMALEAYKKVTAPFDGVVTARNIDIGDLVTAGSTSNTTSLYTIAQINEIRVFVDVPQRAAGGMVVGTPAVAMSNEFPGRKFTGRIARTSNAISPDTRTLRVEVDLPNPDDLLTPGMYMEVVFQVPQHGLIAVPASALLFRSNDTEVAVVPPDDRVEFRKVSIAVDQGDYVEVGSGLQVNDRVALNISNQIASGDLVTPTQADHPASTTPSVASAVAQTNR